MWLEKIEQRIDFKALKEEFRRIGTNFVTAGVVGVFINHYVGSVFFSYVLGFRECDCNGYHCAICGCITQEKNMTAFLLNLPLIMIAVFLGLGALLIIDDARKPPVKKASQVRSRRQVNH